MKRIYYIILAFIIVLIGCTDEETMKVATDDAVNSPICIRGNIKQLYASRVNDGGFGDGDAIGVFVANYFDGKPSKPGSGVHNASNVKFTLDGKTNKWIGVDNIYWMNKETPIDAYSYFPYNESVTDMQHYLFDVAKDQSATVGNTSVTAYEKSDFLWAKTEHVMPTTRVVNLLHNHLMAGIRVTLLKGKGMTDEEWNQAEKTVLVENTKRQACINLFTGKVGVAPNADKPCVIKPCSSHTDFWAVVVPQQVKAESDLLSITVGTASYHHKRKAPMNYESGKCYKFTIYVEKGMEGGDYEFSVVQEAVSPWENDPISHNGNIKEYVVVDVPEAGTLEQQMCTVIDHPERVTNLKVRGELTQKDFEFMHERMSKLEAINFSEVKLKRCGGTYDSYGHPAQRSDDVLPYKAFKSMNNLRHFVFPKVLKEIGDEAFRSTILTGSLTIPEGVKRIGSSAFSCWAEYTETVPNLSGELVLPSTLEEIGYAAFRECAFTGELRLPEKLRIVEDEAFLGCMNFEGELRIPASVTKIGHAAFAQMNGLNGQLVIPKGLERIEEGAFDFPMSSVTIPEGVTYIGQQAFGRGAEIDLHLPSTINVIGEAAFAQSKFLKVNLPENLDFIEKGAFFGSNLRDTLTIPAHITRIPNACFNDSKKLRAVLLSAAVEHIDAGAFNGCYDLEYLRCMGEVPPVIHGNCFDGVAKDNFTVEVPPNAVDAYRSAPFWSEFKRISAYRNFVCRPSVVNLLNAGGTREIILNADAGWKMISCPSWCKVTPTSGVKKTRLQLSIDRLAHNNNARTDSIVFELEGTDARKTHINISQYDYMYEEDERIQLQKATKGKGIDVFIVGDGYDARDIANGFYLRDMQQEVEYFFGVEPYTTYRDYFNFYTAIALSDESGIGTLNTLRRTKFETSMATYSPQGRIGGNSKAILNYAAKAVPSFSAEVPNNLIILLANTSDYDGVTNMWSSGGAISYCTKSTQDYPFDARGVVQHEAGGHGFGKLGDEYIYHREFIQRCSCSCCEHVQGLLEGKALGWYDNLSLHGKYASNEWRQFIFHPNYANQVDLFEGGFFHSRGVYRPEYNSCMNNNVPYFNAPSRYTIVQRIMHMAGEEFTFENFVAKDKNTMGKDFTDGSRAVMTQKVATRHLHAPIIHLNGPAVN